MLAPAVPNPEAPERDETAAAHDVPYRFELVTSRAAFDALESAWNDLYDRAGRGSQVFQKFNWNWHWCNHYLDEADAQSTLSLAIVTAWRGDRIALVLPLAVIRAAGLKQLVWMGEPVSQYGDALVEDGPGALPLLTEAWQYAIDQIQPDVANLRKVRDDAAIAPLLAELPHIKTQELAAPYLDIGSAPDFDAYQERYSPRSRRNRRRLGRRFAERGKVQFERPGNGARARELALAAIDLKRDWLKDRGLVSTALFDPRMADFFADVAEGASHPADCQVSALMTDDTPAAIEITLSSKDHIAMHVIVFNLAFEKAGAGVLLLEETIANAFGNGCRSFDLLSPADGYKVDWADAAVGVGDYAVPLSYKGSLYARVYLGLVRPGLKRALEAMPRSLRRRLTASQAAS
jgi:CelD/BcsL family acetyltransferase involved in cellulose biosynthesis